VLDLDCHIYLLMWNVIVKALTYLATTLEVLWNHFKIWSLVVQNLFSDARACDTGPHQTLAIRNCDDSRAWCVVVDVYLSTIPTTTSFINRCNRPTYSPKTCPPLAAAVV